MRSLPFRFAFVVLATGLVGLAVAFWRPDSEALPGSIARGDGTACATPAVDEERRGPRETREPRTRMKSM